MRNPIRSFQGRITQDMADAAMSEMQEILDKQSEAAPAVFKQIREVCLADPKERVPDAKSIAMALWYEAREAGYDHVMGMAFAEAFLYGYCVCMESVRLKGEPK